MRLALFGNGICLSAFAGYCGGTLYGSGSADRRAFGISLDSREAIHGDVFFAVSGDNFDGHGFVSQAAAMGAVCAVVSKIPENITIPYILVEDTRRALGLFAAAYKRVLCPTTIAVTGSVGKTTTKQYISSILSTRFNTVKTEGNFNNEIGLPLTLLNLGQATQMLVVEMGMRSRGEISYLSRIARPDISVITNIGSAHIENLGSREKIRDAKLEIADGMDTGVLLMNGDEPLLYDARDIPNAMKMYFGTTNPKCDFFAENIRQENKNIVFDVRCPGRKKIYDLKISGYGIHNVYDALAAVACGLLSEIDENGIREGLADFVPVALRQSITQKDGFTLIEDCYNAGPESMRAAIDTLCGISKGRKIAVLGDMKELGPYSSRLHYLLGEKIAETNIDMLVTIGPEAIKIAKGAYSGGMPGRKIISIEDASDPLYAADTIKELLQSGDTVLLKASRALALERISNLL